MRLQRGIMTTQKYANSARETVLRIQQAIKDEVLQPAKQEAAHIIETARQQAEELLLRAKEEARHISEEAKKEQERLRSAVESLLKTAVVQAREKLKQEILTNIFRKELFSSISKDLRSPKSTSQIVSLLIDAMDRKIKSGSDAHFEIELPVGSDVREVCLYLTDQIKKRIEEQGAIRFGDFSAGGKLRLEEEQLVIDMSDEAVSSLLERLIQHQVKKILLIE